jgi:DnaJ-domain-containing protein 1
MTAGQIETTAILESREAARGGPFFTVRCLACGTRCGALRNKRGRWLVHPLEGATEPSLLDKLVPRTSREHVLRGRRWWLQNAAVVERFRQATRDRKASAPPPKPPPPRRPPPGRKRTPTARATTRASSPRDVLGVAADASLADVRRAWRAAVKRWHPDRIPTRDPVVIAESERRFRELRAAYESLVAELSR